MCNRRTVWAWLTFLVVAGILGGTVGYGAYYRSDLYRRRIERGLGEFLGLPTEIAAIGPYSFTARWLENVEVWLPQYRARIFRCPLVIWDTCGTEEGEGTVLRIYDPTLLIGSEGWESQDYLRVLRASFQHDFGRLKIRKIQFNNAQITWPRRDFRLNAEYVSGSVLFERTGCGKAELIAYSLNDIEVVEPIRILARIDPHREDFLPEVTLVVPPLPLAALGLDQVLQSAVTQGEFAGKITLYQCPEGNEIRLTGFAREVEIGELTTYMPGGAVRVLVSLNISEALIRDRRLVQVTFNGEVRRLDVDSLLGRFGLPALGGEVHLSVDGGQIRNNRIQRLRLMGQWSGISPDALVKALGYRGNIRGQVRIQVNNLLIEDNELVSGDVDLIVEPPADGRGTIDQALLMELIQQQLGLSLPANLLPAEVEYIQLGAKLVISRTHLRVLSLPGPAGPAIITARIFDQDVPLLGKTDQIFEVDSLIQRLRERVGGIRYAWPESLKRAIKRVPSTQAN